MTGPHPSDGVRLLLVRQSVTESQERAEYTAQVYTPTEVFSYSASLAMDGSAELAATGSAAAEDDEKRLLNIARSTARSARRKADEGLAPWPHRIMRWRK